MGVTPKSNSLSRHQMVTAMLGYCPDHRSRALFSEKRKRTKVLSFWSLNRDFCHWNQSVTCSGMKTPHWRTKHVDNPTRSMHLEWTIRKDSLIYFRVCKDSLIYFRVAGTLTRSCMTGTEKNNHRCRRIDSGLPDSQQPICRCRMKHRGDFGEGSLKKNNEWLITGG